MRPRRATRSSELPGRAPSAPHAHLETPRAPAARPRESDTMHTFRLLTLLTLTTACGAPAGAPEASHAAPAASAPEPAAPSSTHTWLAPRRPESATALELAAELVPAERARAELTMPLSGRILDVRVAPGDRVRAGQPLMVVALPEASVAYAALARAESGRALVDARRARVAELEREGLSRTAELMELDAERVRLTGELATARAILVGAGLDPTKPEGDTTTLRASIDGVITVVSAVRGQYRRPEDGALLVLHAGATRRVQATLPEPPPPGARFVWVVPGSPDVELTWLSSVARVGEGRVGITAWLESPPDQPLGHGRAGRLELHLPATADAHVVPATALLRESGRARLRVRSAAGVEELREATLLMTLGADVLVRAALAEGERVALEAGERS